MATPDQHRLTELYARFLAGESSPEELDQLFAHFHTLDADSLNQLIEAELAITEPHTNATPAEAEQLQQVKAKLDQHLQKETRLTGQVRRLWPRIAAAASILVILSVSAYFLFHQQTGTPTNTAQAENVFPAKQGVTLTVAGHQPINIAYHHRGQVTAGAQQISQTDSLLTYTKGQTIEMQTLTNNSGHRITVQLADGTEATLDVASELRYPSAFIGSERRVSLAGQAYFKVKHNTRQPFRVQAGEQLVEDIGTEFNVNTFQNTSTTLIEGSVKIAGRVLKPGEMATSEHGSLSVAPADVSEVVAWLQDRIMYKNARLGTVMDEVSRVYHVKIVWQDDLKDRRFYVILNRKRSLVGVLNYFRKVSDVDFKLEDNTLTVFKKKPIK